jgi:hypothetical protein
MEGVSLLALLVQELGGHLMWVQLRSPVVMFAKKDFTSPIPLVFNAQLTFTQLQVPLHVQVVLLEDIRGMFPVRIALQEDFNLIIYKRCASIVVLEALTFLDPLRRTRHA